MLDDILFFRALARHVWASPVVTLAKAPAGYASTPPGVHHLRRSPSEGSLAHPTPSMRDSVSHAGSHGDLARRAAADDSAANVLGQDSLRQRLRMWMDRAGVLRAEPEEPMQRTPVQWKLVVHVHAMRLRMLCDAPSSPLDDSAARLDCTVLDVSEIDVVQKSDLEGIGSDHISIASVTLSAQLADRSSGARPWTQHSLIEQLTSPSSSVAALSITHQSWPASVGSWQAGSSILNAGSDAGSALSITVAPLCINVVPSAAQCLHRLVEECHSAAESPSQPLLPEPPHASTVSVSIGASMVLLPHESQGVVQLDIADVELVVRSPAPDCKPSHADAARHLQMSPDLPAHSQSAQSSCTELKLWGMSLRFRTGAETRTLVTPFDCTYVSVRTVHATSTDRETVDMSLSNIVAHCDLVDALCVHDAVLAIGANLGGTQAADEALREHVAANGSSLTLKVQHVFDISICCEGIRAVVSWRGSRAEANAERLCLQAAQSRCSDSVLHGEVQLTAQCLHVDVHTGTADDQPSLHARSHRLSFSSTQSGQQMLIDAAVEVARVFVAQPCSTTESILLQMGSGQQRAIFISAAVEPGLHDAAISLSGIHVAVSDVAPCAQVVHDLSVLCEMAMSEVFGRRTNVLGPPPSSLSKPAPAQALALRVDTRRVTVDLHLPSEAPHGPNVLCLQVGCAWLALLFDRSGGQRFDGQLEGLSVSGRTPQQEVLVTLLRTTLVAASGSLPSACELHSGQADCVLHARVGDVNLSLPQEHREQISQLAVLLRRTSESFGNASTAQATDPLPLMHRLDIHLRAARVALDAGPVHLAFTELSVRYREHGQHQNVAVAFELEHAGLGSSLLTATTSSEAAAGDQHAASPTVRFDMDIQPTGMLVQMACSQLEVRLCASDVEHVLPLLECVEMPAASDVPFTADVTLGHLGLVLVGEGHSDAPVLRIATAMTMQFCTAGGIYHALSARLFCSLAGLCIDLSSADSSSAVLLSACDVGMRMRFAASRVRAIVRSSDMHLQASIKQMRLVAHLLDAAAEKCSLLLQAASRIAIASSLISDTASEVSEYFDADDSGGSTLGDLSDARSEATAVSTHGAEPTDDDGSVGSTVHIAPTGQRLAQLPGGVPVPEGSSRGAHLETIMTDNTRLGSSRRGSTLGAREDATNEASDIRCEVKPGVLIFTLLDDYAACVGAPVLQLSLEMSDVIAIQTAASAGLVVSVARFQPTVHHYAREHTSMSQRWEPVLASCTLAISANMSTSNLDITSSGPVELDVSTRLVASLLGLQQRLASATSVASASDNALTLVPFVLHNETGTAMVVLIDSDTGRYGHQPITKVPPGGVARTVASPAQLAQSGSKVRVIFQGFQQMDLRPTAPPYTKWRRLWPAGEARGSSAIINVLIESSMENGVEHCTLHSRVALVNCCEVRYP